VAQEVLVALVAQALVTACPGGWRGAQVVQRQVGSRVERELTVLTDDGPRPVPEPPELDDLLARLRTEGPLWFTARVRVAPPDRFSLDTDVGPPAMTGGPVGWRELASDPAVRAAEQRPAWVDTALAAALLAGAGTTAPADPVLRAGGRVEPLPGEPPLSLLRSVQMVTLPVGTEVDRLGTGEGNVVWVARTPWPLRSLPPDHAERPYAAFALVRPVEALVGEAGAWFGQPGGGTAFVLPRSVDALVADGALRRLV
jgi:hypothetical protein